MDSTTQIRRKRIAPANCSQTLFALGSISEYIHVTNAGPQGHKPSVNQTKAKLSSQSEDTRHQGGASLRHGAPISSKGGRYPSQDPTPQRRPDILPFPTVSDPKVSLPGPSATFPNAIQRTSVPPESLACPHGGPVGLPGLRFAASRNASAAFFSLALREFRRRSL